MYECEGCGRGYDPIGCRWRCPHCGFKGNCCEGAPLPVGTAGSTERSS